MTIRVAINGLGRIGRCVVRALYEELPISYRELYPALSAIGSYRDRIELVAINELATAEMVVHLLKYDSSHGLFPCQVSYSSESSISIGEDIIPLFNQSNPSELPWEALNVDVVLECSGVLRSKKEAMKHISDAGAQKVLLSNPAQPDVDATIVFGVNHHTLRSDHQVVSNASCTTNCLVPILSTLHQQLGILQGKVTTIHSAMNDQPVIDAFNKDLRKARSASHSIIPVSTGLARGVARIMPELGHCIEAQAIRVPTTNVSVMDISLLTGQKTSVEDVNRRLQQAANGSLSGILGFTKEPLVSCDFNHDSRSAVIDGIQTLVTQPNQPEFHHGSMISLLAWFDNEWAYANRMLDNTILMMS